jgi:hypothetical protein
MTGSCADCGRPRKPGALFCECGALLDYSAPETDGQTDESTNGGGNDAAVETTENEHEWPPGPYQSTREPTVGKAATSLRVVHCPNEECQALNPATLLFCWNCESAMARGVEAKQPWSLKRALRLEKPPLPAGERQRAGSFLAKDGRILRVALVVLAVLLLLAAVVIGAVKAWGPAEAHAAHWYNASREALFPEFDPVYPSSVNPPRKKNPAHPAADAFDRNLSTYWQSTTPRQVWDKIRVNFKPAAKEIDEVSVFAGDPTATTIVPESIQMTFYRWEPHPRRNPQECKVLHGMTQGPGPQDWLRPVRGVFCVIGKPKQFDLVNTPTEQRFSTGKQEGVGQVVITIRGVHRADNPKAKAALTDVEFFAKH